MTHALFVVFTKEASVEVVNTIVYATRDAPQAARAYLLSTGGAPIATRASV
jgi:hypothetical protein